MRKVHQTAKYMCCAAQVHKFPFYFYPLKQKRWEQQN